MKLALKQIHSPDTPGPVADYAPNDPADVFLLLQLMIGPVDAPGEESFDVIVATPKALMKAVESDAILEGRHMLVVREWNFSKIIDFVEKRIQAIEEDDWASAATKLGRLGKWEFEDYVA